MLHLWIKTQIFEPATKDEYSSLRLQILAIPVTKMLTVEWLTCQTIMGQYLEWLAPGQYTVTGQETNFMLNNVSKYLHANNKCLRRTVLNPLCEGGTSRTTGSVKEEPQERLAV